jgi:hypothetical protein
MVKRNLFSLLAVAACIPTLTRCDNAANSPPNPRVPRTDAGNPDALQAQIDALRAENAALKAARVDTAPAPAPAPAPFVAPPAPAPVPVAPAMNLGLRIKAARFLSDAEACDVSRSDEDVARAAVAKFAPSENLTGKSIGYLEARLDIQLSARSDVADRNDSQLARAAGGIAGGAEDVGEAELARLENVKVQGNLWKGDHK